MSAKSLILNTNSITTSFSIAALASSLLFLSTAQITLVRSFIAFVLLPLLLHVGYIAYSLIRKFSDVQYNLAAIADANSDVVQERIEEDENELPVEYSGKVQYMKEGAEATLTKRMLKIQAKGVTVTLDLKKEVYACKESSDKFIVYALVNQVERNEFVFATKDYQEWSKRINQYLYDLPEPVAHVPKRFALLVINPMSGGKTGKMQFENIVKPILEDCSHVLGYDLVYTERPNHGEDIVSKTSLNRYDAIGCGGGDGTTHECMSGLMKRKDWRTAIKTPLCPIPMGTSNALAASLYGSKNTLELSAFALVRGFQKPLDVSSVIQNGKRRYSFLTVMWGFLANVTHKTDHLRRLKLGPVRNIVGALIEIVRGHSYDGELSYIKYESETGEMDPNDPGNLGNQKTKHKKQRINIYQDKIADVGEENGENQSLKPVEEPSLKEHVAGVVNGPDCPKIREFFPECFGKESKKESKAISIKENFFAVQSCNVSHIARDHALAPTAYANSAYMDILWIKKSTFSRLEFLKMFLRNKTAPKEQTIHHETILRDKTQVFKLEPVTKGSHLSIDGEEGEYTTTFVEIHPGLASVLVL
jgi:diacylglycerol kinase family enzyme